MNLTPVITPKLAKSLFPDLVWDLPSKEKVIYLTFDDGPTPIITDWTLDVLTQYNANATFFCIGKNVDEHPSIFKRILSEGHSVGNHSYNHLKGWNTKTKDYIDNILKAEVSIEQAKTIYRQSLNSKLFRPPYGQIKPRQAKS